ncbi:MAG TPA: histidine kinase dimerization/phospho-acceptor domain-containing protein [Gemmatimonadales bacterium]|nr:histidine kinase dimerization/phospho-acceptor domain-containing protein [Gemmatimonadales bacterium]
MTSSADDSVRRLRHDLANPLAAILAEVQLLLLNTERYDEETRTSLGEIEKLARRMRDLLQSTAAPQS